MIITVGQCGQPWPLYCMQGDFKVWLQYNLHRMRVFPHVRALVLTSSPPLHDNNGGPMWAAVATLLHARRLQGANAIQLHRMRVFPHVRALVLTSSPLLHDNNDGPMWAAVTTLLHANRLQGADAIQFAPNEGVPARARINADYLAYLALFADDDYCSRAVDQRAFVWSRKSVMPVDYVLDYYLSLNIDYRQSAASSLKLGLFSLSCEGALSPWGGLVLLSGTRSPVMAMI